MIYFLIGFPLVVVLSGIAMWIQFSRINAQVERETTPHRSTLTVEQRLVGARTSQEFLGFETLIDDMVKVTPCRYRAYIEVEPVPFYLMSPEEQASMEAAFRAFVDGLRWPIQLFIGSMPLDVTVHVREVRTRAAGFSDPLRSYGEALARFTEAWADQFAPITRRYVIVVPFDYISNPRKPLPDTVIEEEARRELNTRVASMLAGLSAARLSARRLGADEILAFLYKVYHRESSVLGAYGLGQANPFALYVTSVPTSNQEV